MPTGDHTGNNYTPEERDRGLTALALRGGSVTRAQELLKDDPEMPRVPSNQTLSKWMREHAGRYSEILVSVAPQIEAEIKHDYRQIVARTNEVHLDAIELASSGFQNLDKTDPEVRAQQLAEARDASQVAKNLAIAGGVAADKLALAEGRPTSITEHRDPDTLLRAIEAIAGRRDSIDSTAVEEPPPIESAGAPELASPSD